MAHETFGQDRRVSRRALVKQLGATLGVTVAASRVSFGQAPSAIKRDPPSTVTSPPRDFSPDAPPVSYPDPDVLTIDPMFNRYRVGNTAIHRLWTGGQWCEGPAWCAQGRYLIWSDIPNNRQLRWLEEDGHVSVFRSPSNNSNGNAFDFQGRQLTCEHLTRRVVRYEHDGSVTVIADRYDGKHLNSPNDLATHQDGSIWFTDPAFGEQMYEGVPDAAGGPSNQAGRLRQHAGQPAEVGTLKRELPMNVYRADPSGRVDLVIGEDQLPTPNGIAFSPDFKKLYVVTQGNVAVLELGAGNKVSSHKLFATFTVDGIRCATDGIRVDVDGNLWCASSAGANVGYSGVTIWNPDGALIGRIRLPETCANVTFGGSKRNRLFMAASQSLYAMYVNTQGAAPG
ncbi:MAG TPA: SMP-30/gluconolactonase/LRE family protein [Vicinamibacterales bacterium]|nr:SMP-30/gluconolactonase/LRE family protein [Vicinamibacterales bacterium]